MRTITSTLIAVSIAGLLALRTGLTSPTLGVSNATAGFQQNTATSPEGAALYQERCAVCHDNPQDRVPPLFLIRRRAAEDVIQTLTTGVMRQQASGLSPDQIRALAIHLTGKQPGTGPTVDPDANRCKAAPAPVDLNGQQWNGWGRDLLNTRFQPAPGIKPEDVPKLKVKWAFAHPGPMATGQPSIVGDHLYVTTEAGLIYCLNAQTGCTYWTVNAGAEVRTPISVGPMPAGSPVRAAAYFGDERSNIQALDAATGRLLWKTKIEDHLLSRITGTPLLYGNRIYAPVSSFEETAGRDAKYECCTFRGSLVALDAYTGHIIWKSYTVQDPPGPFKKNSVGTQMYGPAGGAIWSAPTLDLKRKVIYVGSGNSYTDVRTAHSDAIIAFDMDTGRLKWANQLTPKDNFLVGCRQPGVGNCPEDAGPDYDFGSSPVLRTLPGGRDILLAAQKSGVVYALDPDAGGKKLWETRLGNGGALGGIEWGIAADLDAVYVPVADVGVSAEQRRPGITALKIATGEKLWQVPAPAPKCAWGTARCLNSLSAAATAIPGVIFSGSLDGHLRAYSARDGAVVWDFDTAAASYTGVNGAPARGGALDGGGPVIAGGVLYCNSGYGRLIGQPGNLLLAFTVDVK